MLVFPITTGRSGTAFLTRLLQQNLDAARVYHERTNFITFGIDTPDASDLMQFNNAGVTRKVREFWRRKFQRVLDEPGRVYAEVSHFLAKAGLVDNLDLLPDDVTVKLIHLTREPEKIALSYHNRGVFENLGWTWLFTLDPRWTNVIVQPKVFGQAGPMGWSLWYVMEMRARAAYYQEVVRADPRVEIIEISAKELSDGQRANAFLDRIQAKRSEVVTIPERQNSTQNWRISKDERERFEAMCGKVRGDPGELGREFHASGHRLATASIATRNRATGMV